MVEEALNENFSFHPVYILDDLVTVVTYGAYCMGVVSLRDKDACRAPLECLVTFSSRVTFWNNFLVT